MDLEWNNVEIIFDRYYENMEKEANFKRYIQDGYELPLIDQVTQVSSEYCEGVQIADALGSVVKGNLFDLKGKNINFIQVVRLDP
jgi:hypothetical protein